MPLREEQPRTADAAHRLEFIRIQPVRKCRKPRPIADFDSQSEFLPVPLSEGNRHKRARADCIRKRAGNIVMVRSVNTEGTLQNMHGGIQNV